MQAQQQKLQRRLQNFYSKKASKLGLGLTPSCCTMLERMIGNGVERMLSQGVGDREEQVLVAERNLALYLQKLATESQSRGIYPQVGAKAFDSVFNSACPLWPFC